MLKNMKYSVTFPTNGITLEGDFSLEPGATAITGPNGSGKTFGSLEIWRYLLFGKEALRGPASDYKKLDAEGTCVIGGAEYTIVRHSKKESITDADGQVLAVNASAVTQKVRELLGFNLAVFDVVCCAVQKDKSGFSDLLPTARKKLIDDIVGLSAQETVEKDCKAEAKKHRMTASVLMDGHVKPTEVKAPAGYLPSEEIEKLLESSRTYELALSKLTSEEPAPVPPTEDRVDDGDVSVLVQRVEDTKTYNRLKAEVDAIVAPEHSLQVIELAEAYNLFVLEHDKRGEKSSHSPEYLDHQEHLLALATIGDIEVECPDCGHAFAPGHSRVADLSKAEIAAARRAHILWETPLTDVNAPDVMLSAAEITTARRDLDNADRVELLHQQMEDLEEMREAMAEEWLREAQKNQEDWRVYDVLFKNWSTREDIRLENQRAFDLLETPLASVEHLQNQMVEARVYETEVANYGAQRLAYDTRNDRIIEAETLNKEFTAGAVALSETRMAIKAFLAPSLSRVASNLIAEMTAGKLNTVVVDEEMNVTVDGQDITTLSGAGTTVANLALRIALGQVLVSKVFSVFIGDELDKDMDTERSASTADALARLSNKLDQLILITHKDVDFADHHIMHTNQ